MYAEEMSYIKCYIWSVEFCVHSFIAVWEMLVRVGIATPPWWLVDYGDWSYVQTVRQYLQETGRLFLRRLTFEKVSMEKIYNEFAGGIAAKVMVTEDIILLVWFMC